MTAAIATLAATLVGGVAAFQAALAAGAPWGAYSWGGARLGRLPLRLRIISALAVPVLVFLALVLLAQGGVLGWSPLPVDWLVPATWVVAVLLALNTVANLAAPSRVERFVFGGTTALLVVLCVILALAGEGPLSG
jgi:hypothetical protein